jgi:hypothetical protein
MIKYMYGNHAIYALMVAGGFMILGAIAAIFVKDTDDLALKS